MSSINKYFVLILCLIMIFSCSACSSQESQALNDDSTERSQNGAANSDNVASSNPTVLPEATILGQWVPEDGETGHTSQSYFWNMDNLEFFSDGTGTNEHESFNWIAENGRLKIECKGSSPDTYDYVLGSSYLYLKTHEDWEYFVRPGCTPIDLQGKWNSKGEVVSEAFPSELAFEYLFDDEIQVMPSDYNYCSLSLDNTCLYGYDIIFHGELTIAQSNQTIDVSDIIAWMEGDESRFTEEDFEVKVFILNFVSPSKLYLTDPDTQEVVLYEREE